MKTVHHLRPWDVVAEETGGGAVVLNIHGAVLAGRRFAKYLWVGRDVPDEAFLMLQMMLAKPGPGQWPDEERAREALARELAKRMGAM